MCETVAWKELGTYFLLSIICVKTAMEGNILSHSHSIDFAMTHCAETHHQKTVQCHSLPVGFEVRWAETNIPKQVQYSLPMVMI
jgi:hypothetical protein